MASVNVLGRDEPSRRYKQAIVTWAQDVCGGSYRESIDDYESVFRNVQAAAVVLLRRAPAYLDRSHVHRVADVTTTILGYLSLPDRRPGDVWSRMTFQTAVVEEVSGLEADSLSLRVGLQDHRGSVLRYQEIFEKALRDMQQCTDLLDQPYNGYMGPFFALVQDALMVIEGLLADGLRRSGRINAPGAADSMLP